MLKLDDEVYFYNFHNDQTIEISEGYKISAEFEISVQNIGTWSKNDGLKISEPNKAWRRRDLQGKNILIPTLYGRPFVEAVNETLITGSFGDVMESLKVRYTNPHLVQKTNPP